MKLSNLLKRRLFCLNALSLAFCFVFLFFAYAVYNYYQDKSLKPDRVETTQEIEESAEENLQTPEQFLVQPGTYTTSKIFVANLATSGSPAPATITLYSTTGATQQISFPNIYPGGVSMITDSGIPTGLFSAVLQSQAPVAAVALSQNSSNKSADDYLGFNTPSTTLFAPIIFNKHANFESILYCQNTSSTNATINAELYQAGVGNPKVVLNNTVNAQQAVKWDIADDSRVQGPWPGGNGQYGYAKFTSTVPIACTVDNQRMVSPYADTQYSAFTQNGADTTLYVPLVFYGHGSSSSNRKDYKLNTGIAMVNTNGSAATVTVVYSSQITVRSGNYNVGPYTKTCTKTIPAYSSANWYTPDVGTGTGSGVGWSCNSDPQSGLTTLPWWYPGGPTYGSAKITSNIPIMGIANSNKYDPGVGLGAGFSGNASGRGIATAKAVCPMAFNKNVSSDWLTGIRVVNMGTTAQTVNWTMVRANVDPNIAGNKKVITRTVQPQQGVSVYFPDIPTEALANFEGAVFVQANDPAAKLAASSSNSNYNTLGSASMYDCLNY